ncbi:nuclear transport factor 2 family protein [Kitasatospora sp. NPDC058444]|uniref:nuclear transport factor 2 family protein n=1 Tax=Kitasatospora sp. NPDC058444 TaxID=3346504 RepID=UPI0036603EE6
MNKPQHRSSTPDALPDAVSHYLRAHRAHDTAAALAAFADDATVIDDGTTYAGTAAIEKWLNRSASEYTYTTEQTGAEQPDADHCTVTNRLEGDFPGGVVDLHYRFTLHTGTIQRLVIEP